MLAETLVRLRACEEARDWVGTRDLATAWAECPRADWMLWLAGRVGIDRKLLVLAACDCAETSLRFVPAGEDRPRKAIETARAWCRGEATIAEVRAAADAAYAAYAATAYAARAARAAAADAAYAAYAAAADATAYAARAARAAAARDEAFAQMADLVRARITAQDVQSALDAASK